MNLCTVVVLSLAILAVSCVQEGEVGDDVFHVSSVVMPLEGGVPSTPEGDRMDRLPDLEDAGTMLHEPANGYWVADYTHPQTQEYYSTCSSSTQQVPSTDLVTETQVDPETGTWHSYNVVVREQEGVSRYLPNGEIGLVGSRYLASECEYVSGFADCSGGAKLLFDLASYKLVLGGNFPHLAFDAKVYTDSQAFVYFDHGQQSYRRTAYTSQWCEGEDCDFFLIQNLFGEHPECARGSMTVFKRIAPPVVAYE